MLRSSATFPQALIALWLLLCAGCVSAPRGGHPQAQEILAASQKMQDRFAAGDLLAVADFYRSNALVLGTEGFRIDGREAIDSHLAKIEDPLEWRLETRSIEGGKGLAIQRGTSIMTFRWDGEMISGKSDFLLIWSKAAGEEWQVLLDAQWEPEATNQSEQP